MARDLQTTNISGGQIDILSPSMSSPRHPIAPFGLSVITRAPGWSARKQLETYEKLETAKNRLIAAITEQHRLIDEQIKIKIALTHTAAEAEAWLTDPDSIQRMARAKVAGQLAKIENEAKQDSRDEQLRERLAQVEMSELAVREAQAKRNLEAINSPREARASGPAPSIADKIKSKLDEIATLDSVIAAKRQEKILEAGGEEKLSPSVRALFEQLELMRANIVANMFEDIG